MSLIYPEAALVAFFTATAATLILAGAFARRKLFVSSGIPLAGGLGIGISFFVASLIGFNLSGALTPPVQGILLASLLMLLFGLVDDLKELSITAKFLAQSIATLILIAFGVRAEIVHIGFVANIAITFLWVLGITNAINHLDVMDGLAGAVSLIAGLSFFVISSFIGDTNSAILSLVLCSAVISFLVFNLPPAKIYMGNCGSHFLGFVLAAVALNISYAPIEKRIALLSPLLILGFPIFDTAFLIMVRLSKGKLPFKKSNDHPALLFQAAGYSKRKTLFILGALCLFFSTVGLMVKWLPNLLGTTLVLTAIAAISFMIKKVYSVVDRG